MKSKEGYSTLAEHNAKLKAEGKWDEYLARTAEAEAAHQRGLDERARAEAPLVAALKAIDPRVWTVFMLDEDYAFSDEIIRILFEHLDRDYTDEIKEGILDALGKSRSKKHWNDFVDFYENRSTEFPEKIRFAAGMMLYNASDDSVIDDVIRLIKDSKFGFFRMPLALILYRSKSPKAKMTLMELRDDPDLGKELKRMRRLARLGPLTKL